MDEDDIKLIISLLEIAKCPLCDGSGTMVTSVHPDGSINEIEQCQWCYEKNRIINL